MVSSISMVTLPRTPSTSRTTSGCCWRMGMQSITRTDPSVGHELGLEHERVAAVVAVGGHVRPLRGEPPRAVVLVPEQLGEAGRRVEAGQAQPVDRPVPADQGRGVEVADDAVILDGERHAPMSSPEARPGVHSASEPTHRRQGQPACSPVPTGPV